MSKIGDIIVCVDTYGISKVSELVKYKKYTISYVYFSNNNYSQDCIRLEEISGSYYIRRFITLSEYRKQLLNKICLKSEML